MSTMSENLIDSVRRATVSDETKLLLDTIAIPAVKLLEKGTDPQEVFGRLRDLIRSLSIPLAIGLFSCVKEENREIMAYTLLQELIEASMAVIAEFEKQGKAQQAQH